jgi:hypothetical protein
MLQTKDVLWWIIGFAIGIGKPFPPQAGLVSRFEGILIVVVVDDDEIVSSSGRRVASGVIRIPVGVRDRLFEMPHRLQGAFGPVTPRGRERLICKGIPHILVLVVVAVVVAVAVSATAENTVGIDEGVHRSGVPPPPPRG